MTLNFLDRIAQQYGNQLPFVAYRKPNEEEVRLILQNDQELHHVVDYRESGFIFAPFNASDEAILLKNDASYSEILNTEKTSENSDSQPMKDDGAGKAFHLGLVQRGIHEIKAGNLDKVVLSREVEVSTSKDPIQLFQNILSLYPTAFCYIWYHPKVGIWLGATPEMLLEMENQRLKTMSLAGTQKYLGEDSPVWGNKELEEQQMVTQFITDSLKDKIKLLTISETMSYRAGNLWHLKTSISGMTTPEIGLSEIIHSLHPTPAVCGLPKLKAKDFILKNEKYLREFYTGFLGELNFKEEVNRPSKRRNQENRAYRTIKNKTSLFVNLRCMKIHKNKLTLYVGGGITRESDPEMEWKETCDKSRTMLNIIRS
ncbi:Isochorismate synthase MenF [Arenibacter antarcticus]|uniref:Chorismate-binding protein n=1 Tax=Arenibacter antarcticus TaxID=2040469 RepID=A0ABW5VDP5_9FLAO|nr:chorismate-binding protein [Arenibacter sp. H213]MCM4168201.1 isochorismate synthase [Arenibacter sp. H213]